MENAPKAFLIAGAILIAIVLISVGMLIVNSTNDATEQTANTATKQSIDVFNSQFVQYEGEQKGSTIKNLYQSVHASTASSVYGEHKVLINNEEPSKFEIRYVRNSDKYMVKLHYGQDGYVNNITIDLGRLLS